ncbi:MAG: peroxiredoxin-like family protein [Myxococcota bacterium]
MGHDLPTIRALGAELVVVGNGSPAMARAFQEDHPLDATLLVNPELDIYRAAGLRRGVMNTLNLGAAVGALRALKHGHMQGLTQGDNWQQGGTFVVWPGGKVGYRFMARSPEEHAPVADVVRALQAGPPG